MEDGRVLYNLELLVLACSEHLVLTNCNTTIAGSPETEVEKTLDPCVILKQGMCFVVCVGFQINIICVYSVSFVSSLDSKSIDQDKNLKRQRYGRRILSNQLSPAHETQF